MTSARSRRSMIHGEPVKRVVQRFFLFGSSAARNSPACKGKRQRCLRKCRFSYIDTSPALPARRHLTAALCYSACPPHRPSCLHLGCQTHQTWCAPGHLGAAPCSAHPIQNFLPGTTVAIVGAIWRMARPRAGLEPNARLCVAFAQVVKMKAGCVAHRSEETEVTSSVSVGCKERGSLLTVNKGGEE